MKALVTGGTGFVGRYLVSALLKKGFSCRLLVRPTSDTSWIERKENVELRQGDVTRPETLDEIGRGVDYVFHLAAAGHVSAISSRAYEKFTAVNVEGTKNIISRCREQGIKKFVFFSSTAAMGLIKKRLVDENDPPQPVTPYQKSKLESERTALQLGGKFDVPVVVLRPCMIYGVGGRGEFFKICRLMKKGLFPKVGRGKNLTPLVHVKDVVAGALEAAENGKKGEVYLLTSEHSIELDRMRELVMQAWGQRAVYPYVPKWAMFFAAGCFELFAKITGTAPLVTRRNIASTVWDREFSIQKAASQLGYRPQISFRNGILETVRWYKAVNKNLTNITGISTPAG